MSATNFRFLSLALAGVIALPLMPAMAQQENQQRSETKQNNKQNNKQTNKQKNKRDNQQNNQQNNQQSSADGVLKHLEQLDLKDEQKQQIRQITQQHNQKLRQSIEQFNQAHMQAVAMEAAMYAAMEAGMDEQQRTQFRSHRDGNSGSPQRDSTNSNSNASKSQSNSDSDKTADAASANRSAQSAGKGGSTQQRSDMQENSAGDRYVSTMIIIPVQQQYSSSGLNEQQRSHCDQTCEKFKDKLVNAWEKIHQHHTELVKLEAAKMTEIQNVLTEDQRKQLQSQFDNDQGSESGR